jgi:opacity protein-like surface antigen
MKRILIIAFSLMVLMSMSSLATNTRVKTMGDNNTILLDDANIWQFPSRINDYPNLAIGEFGQSGDSCGFLDFGIHWQFNEDNPWVLGTYLHNSDVVNPDSSYFRRNSIGYSRLYGYWREFVPFNWDLMSNQRIDLFYGRKLGVNQLPFGIRLSLIHSSQRNDIPTNLDEEGFTVYDLAAGLTLGGGFTDIAAGFQYMTWTDKGTLGSSTKWDESKPKGNYLLYARGRHFWQPGPPAWTLIPHAGIYIGKNEAEYYELNTGTDSLAQTDKYDWFGLELGGGLQYAPSNDAVVILDFGIRYDKLDGEFRNTDTLIGNHDATSKTTAVPFFRAGADLKVFNWMDLRLGATSYWDRYTHENDFPNKLVQNYADNATYLGFGFHWGNLHVDTYTDPQLFLNGFDFISGGGSGDMNMQISALYEIM